ncbi:ubiquinone biosynthesis monooxygenase Coq7 [Pseudoxanthomonas japonensis]|uniref:demethoxyubiquinone hydroxylase family protein n=1 Tax=Pseudoxanthomonas japonensis TaxID=69284 RepID=UPI002862BB92|nr:demethoxyubiquinone hydroxylase family protein [Pseudoxanthomonas japonensis]MDR7067501.1 ubiquinone biosynthesis monooxygenase Coq7 [Pseudoxanthomonas japonensis]
MSTRLGDRILKVDHAGEHGAVNIYRAQILMTRWTAPHLTPLLRHFLEHELGHRALFRNRLQARGIRRCRSYLLCGVGGWALGLVTGLLGASAIAATTYAVESVVLQHLMEQRQQLEPIDPDAFDAVSRIVAEEQEHHDHGRDTMRAGAFWPPILTPVVRASTEAVIWLGMRL